MIKISKKPCGLKLIEARVLTEGTDYEKQAVTILNNAGIWSEEINSKVIRLLFRGDSENEPDIHAFVHAPNRITIPETFKDQLSRIGIDEHSVTVTFT